jgi:acid phosphatase (class A)
MTMKQSLSRWLLVPLLLSVAACSGDRYPFPPQFVDVPDIGMEVLPPPPAADSTQSKREIAGIIARQKLLTDAKKSTVMKEDSISPRMIIEPVLGGGYSEATHPALYKLLRYASSDAWRIGDATQEHWGRVRPWLVDERVQLLVKPIQRPSYPSGHSTTNHVWAHVLSDLFPNQRGALFARAYAIGQHRVDGGVHFPSDVMAGKKMAAAIYAKMAKNPAYQEALTAARAELKTAAAVKAPEKKAAEPVKAAAKEADPKKCFTLNLGKSMTVCP